MTQPVYLTSNKNDATVGYKMTYANKMLDENRQVTYKVGSAF